MKPGTEVKITKGDHKGKRGKIGNNRPSNSLQKGKVPVVVGNKNQVIWTRPDWVEVSENIIPNPQSPVPSPQSPVSSPQSPVPNTQSPELADTEKRILEFLSTCKVPVGDVWVAVKLELPMYQASMTLKRLEQGGLVERDDQDNYHLPKFGFGKYVSDGIRTGLITAHDKDIFTVTFADDSELQCTLEDLRENFQICGNQLELLDSLKASADSVEPVRSSADLNGSSQSNLITMPSKSSEIILPTMSTTETSETTTQSQEQPTSTPLASLVTTQATPATEQDSLETNQDSGWKRSVALLRDYLNSSLSSSQKESFIAACEESLADSEWQDISGKIRSCYRQLVLEQRNAAPGFLQLPTLTANDGKTSRPSGVTRCDRTARKLGLITDSQLLSVEAMAAISGFPTNWTKCLSGLNLELSQEDYNQEFSTAEQSFPSKQQLPSSELSTCGKQWIDPKRIILKHGTQYRHYVDEVYAANPQVVQQYAEMMQAGLWEWEREPLPVAFLSADGKIYAGDCHHRVSAALASSKEIYIDLRPGELVDAQLHSCIANVDHGYQLRAKDQRKRIEMFLDILDDLDEVRSRQLLNSVPGLSEIERRNCQGGKWSARVVAKYLRLTESGYRTVINIQQEREMSGYFSQFNESDWVRVKEGRENGTVFPWGTIAKIQDFDKRKGVFIIPLPGATDAMGRILPSGYIHPECLEKTDAPQLLDGLKNTQPAPITSIEQEIKQQALSVGLPSGSQILPDVERNQGDPHSLVDDRPFAGEGDQLSTWIADLPEENFQKVWSAINQRQPEDVSSFVRHFSDEQLWSAIASRSDETLEKLIVWATEILEQRREEMPHAS